MCRKRGRIVLVGVTGLELSRADFYEKELTFQVSCSYGPGRYDPSYEEGGHDYPLGFVRWTEQRNFEAVLDLMAAGRLDVRPLIIAPLRARRRPRRPTTADRERRAERSASLLEYPDRAPRGRAGRARTAARDRAAGGPPAKSAIGVIGAGNQRGRELIPAFKAAGAALHRDRQRAAASAAASIGRNATASETASTDAARR